MEFWMTGQVYKDISPKYLEIRKNLNEKISFFLSDKTYGKGIVSWNYFVIIDSFNFFNEYKKYRISKKEVEIRLKVDFKEFLAADIKRSYKMVINSILRSIDVAEEMEIKDFDFNKFKSDMISFFRNQEFIENL